MSLVTNDDIARLREKDLPRATADIFGELPEGAVYDYKDQTPEEHAHFFTTTDACPNCGSRYWTWTIMHGTGQCECGWPVRAYHYFKLPDGKKTNVQKALYYHPDEVQVRE